MTVSSAPKLNWRSATNAAQKKPRSTEKFKDAEGSANNSIKTHKPLGSAPERRRAAASAIEAPTVAREKARQAHLGTNKKINKGVNNAT